MTQRQKQNPGLRKQAGAYIASTSQEKAMTEMYQGPAEGAREEL